MHPAAKILVGALMVIVGVYTSVTFWNELLLLVKAGVGPLLVLVGAFIVWLESDEWKMRRETEEAQGIQRQLTADETVTGEEEEEDEGFECPQCGKSFDTERGLHIHQAQKHE
ncbi:MAG: hypothetical protein ABEI58_03155 [Candidatus Nanohaloarchaea archaeon]